PRPPSTNARRAGSRALAPPPCARISRRVAPTGSSTWPAPERRRYVSPPSSRPASSIVSTCRSRRTANPSLRRSSASCSKSTAGIGAPVDPPPAPALHHGQGAFAAPVAEPVARAQAQLAPLAPAAQHDAGAGREPLHAVGVHQIGEAAHAEAVGPKSGEGAAPGDLLDLGADPLQVVAPHGLGHVLEGGGERLGPR